MSSRQEVPYQNGVVAPDPQEVKRVNSFTGPIPPTSRILTGAAAILGIPTALSLMACAPSARPAEVRPAQSEPVPTAQRGLPEGYFTAIAATPKPPESSPRPTETPKPVEKGMFGEWRLNPVSVEDLHNPQPFGVPNIREGYRRLKITFVVKNEGQRLKGAKEIIDSFGFKIQAVGGFSYPEREAVEGGKFLNFGLDVKLPPGFRLPFSVDLDIPANAQEPKVVVTSKTRPQSPTIWALTEFPPPGQERKIDYLPTDKKSLRQLGEPLEQGPLLITPLKSMLVLACTGGYYSSTNWNLAIQYRIENRYGYDLRNAGARFFVFDTNGKAWAGFGSLIPDELPPGITRVSYRTDTVTSNPHSFENICTPGKESPPPKPQQMQLLVWLPELSKVQAKETWAIYDLGDPLTGPYFTGLHSFSGDDARKFFEQVK